MRISGFIKLPRHRTFNYVPRYYDPQKEELNTVVRNAELGVPQKLNKKPKMSYYFNQRRKEAKQTLIRRMIVFVTLILVLIALYYIFSVIYLIF